MTGTQTRPEQTDFYFARRVDNMVTPEALELVKLSDKELAAHTLKAAQDDENNPGSLSHGLTLDNAKQASLMRGFTFSSSELASMYPVIAQFLALPEHVRGRPYSAYTLDGQHWGDAMHAPMPEAEYVRLIASEMAVIYCNHDGIDAPHSQQLAPEYAWLRRGSREFGAGTGGAVSVMKYDGERAQFTDDLYRALTKQRARGEEGQQVVKDTRLMLLCAIKGWMVNDPR